MSNIKPVKRPRSEFAHIRTLLGMSRQEQADFSWSDLDRFYKVTLWDRSHRCKWEKCRYPDQMITSFEEATLDHIIPRSKGGRTRLCNLQLMHSKCNGAKSSTITNQLSRHRFLKAMTPPDSRKGQRTKYEMKRGAA